MRLELECTYCGHKWERQASIFSQGRTKDDKCPKCKDSNVIIKDVSSKIDYYQGSPPFPVEPEDNGLPWGMGGFEYPESTD